MVSDFGAMGLGLTHTNRVGVQHLEALADEEIKLDVDLRSTTPTLDLAEQNSIEMFFATYNLRFISITDI